jgi:hypothetical protein
MSCQDQPLARALSTCRASRTSNRPRRAATARRPTSGLRLLAAARVAASGPVAYSMASRYLDETAGSRLLDDRYGDVPRSTTPRIGVLAPTGSVGAPSGS